MPELKALYLPIEKMIKIFLANFVLPLMALILLRKCKLLNNYQLYILKYGNNIILPQIRVTG